MAVGYEKPVDLEEVAELLTRGPHTYFVNLSRTPQGWNCVLYKDGAKSESPPQGSAPTALAAVREAMKRIKPL